MKRKIFCSGILLIGSVIFCVSFADAQTILMAYCSETYQETGECPVETCKLSCAGSEDEKECQPVCLPQDCTLIIADQCPPEYCVVMKDCSGEEICHDLMEGAPGNCGDLAYAGQDVECCEGFVKRCGIEFFEGICDMEGKNSVYNLPICIPCGDGICGQFENRCNCPEDCGEPLK